MDAFVSGIVLRVPAPRLPEPLDTGANSVIVSVKPDFSLPEPWKTVWYTVVVLIMLAMFFAGALLQFPKNPLVAVLALIIGLALITLVVFVFVRLVFWKKDSRKGRKAFNL